MKSLNIKDEISHYLEKADDRFLQLVHGMMVADQMLTKVGSNPDGSAITREDLILRAEKSEEDIREGRVQNLKQLRNEVKNW